MSLYAALKTLFVIPVGLLAACGTTYDNFLVSLVPRPQEPKQRTYEFREVEFANPRDGTKIVGELTYPSAGDKFPAFVLISGHESGAPPAERNYEIEGHQYFLVMSDLLAKRGYAVLRFDNRGVGKSSGNYVTATDDEFASDAAAALEWLRNKSGINTSFSGFIGHSQGSVKALIAASLEEPDYVIGMAGLGLENLAETLVRQNRDINTAIGLEPSKVDQSNQELSDLLDIILTSKDISDVEIRVREYAVNAGITSEKKLEKISETFATNWWFKELRRDMQPLLTSYEGPVLGLFGSKDLLVSASAFEEPLRNVLIHQKSEVHTFEGLNHLFQPAKKGTGPYEYAEIETTIEEAVIDKIDVWVNSIVNDAAQ